MEIRKENEEFKKVYEGSERNCLIKDLDKETEYEFKICSFYENIIGTWTEIKKFKTLNFKSKILSESKREKEFLEQIYEWKRYKKLELLYRGSRDGFLSKNFHEKCDNKGATIILYQNVQGYIFGGYAPIPWRSEQQYRPDSECFIFTLTNIHNSKPTKFPTKSQKEGIKDYTENGPSFGQGCDINLNDDFIKKDCTSDFPCRYLDTLGKGKSIFTGDNNNGKFWLKEVEVFSII